MTYQEEFSTRVSVSFTVSLISFYSSDFLCFCFSSHVQTEAAAVSMRLALASQLSLGYTHTNTHIHKHTHRHTQTHVCVELILLLCVTLTSSIFILVVCASLLCLKSELTLLNRLAVADVEPCVSFTPNSIQKCVSLTFHYVSDSETQVMKHTIKS